MSSGGFSALLPDHGVKIKESEKIDKYLDLAGEFKKLAIECVADYDINQSYHMRNNFHWLGKKTL